MAAPVSFAKLLQRLRAAAEPSRLRILAVCASGELTVGELSSVLEQSQPRVSRHLRLLCEAGLLVKFREAHRVYYRTPLRGSGAEAVRELLTGLAPTDVQIAADRERSAQVRAERAADAAAELKQSATGRSPATPLPRHLQSLLLQELGSSPVGELLDIGTGTGRLLRWLAPLATVATGVDVESRVLRIARTAVHGAGLSHVQLQQGDMHALPFPAGSFDTIAIDHILAETSSPQKAILEAARLLRPGGRLIVIEDFDRLEKAGERNALATLRAWLERAGLECQRLRPLDADHEHLLFALGRRRETFHAAA